MLFAQGWISGNPKGVGEIAVRNSRRHNFWLGRHTRQQKSNCQKVFILLQFTAEDLILTFDRQNKFVVRLETQLCLEGEIAPRADKGGSWVISSEWGSSLLTKITSNPSSTSWTEVNSDFGGEKLNKPKSNKATNYNRTVPHRLMRNFITIYFWTSSWFKLMLRKHLSPSSSSHLNLVQSVISLYF